MTKLRLLLADDHTLVREGLRRLLESEPDMEVIGEASDGEEAIERTKELQPDVALMDLSMPRMNGTQATRRLREACPGVHVLALTVHEDNTYVRELLSAGASGYVLKRAAANELIHAIRAVAGGGIYVDPNVTAKLLNGVVAAPVRPVGGVGQLSEREGEVLRLTAQGHSNKEIAAQLNVSVKTVETYKARSMEKLGLRSRVDIVRLAAESGWLQPNS